MEKIEQRFMPIFVVGGVTVGSGTLEEISDSFLYGGLAVTAVVNHLPAKNYRTSLPEVEG